jgi:5'-3' exonuclease
MPSKRKTKKNMRKTLLIDGDIFAFKAAVSREVPVNWGDGLWTLHCYEADVFESINKQIQRVMTETGITDLVVAVSDSHNFRKDINPLYKANRKDTRKPLCLPQALQYLKDAYPHVCLPSLEADDVIGILATEEPDKYLIISADKDMRTIPDAYIWEDGAVVHITPEEAYENFITQALKGDPTDGYYGVRGVGEVSARRVIDHFRGTPESLWTGVLKTYKWYEEDAILNARMARILTHDLWDGEKPILWEPPIKAAEIT